MKRNIVRLLTGLFVLLLIAGCSDNTATTPPADNASPSSGAVQDSAPDAPNNDESGGNIGDNRVYGVSVMTMNNPFFVYEVEGVKAAVAGDNHVEVLAPDPANNITTQISQISEFIAKGVDVIIVDPIDSEGIKPSLVEAERAGIPVINIDSIVADTDMVLATIASDNVDAGMQSARVLCEAIGGEGEIAIVNWSALGAVRDRTDGLKKVLAEEYPNVTIVGDQDAYGIVEDAQNITDTFMQAYPNLKGIFAINDPTAQGVVAAIQGANRTGKIMVVSVDGSQNAIEMIRDGQLLCSPMQQPVEIGKLAVELAKQHWSGQSVQKEHVIPVVNITTDNFEEYDGKTY